MRRERRRYIVVRFEHGGIVKRVGERSGCEVSVVRELQPDGLVLGCRHTDLPKVREALKELGVEVLGVSGTIRKAVRKFWSGNAGK